MGCPEWQRQSFKKTSNSKPSYGVKSQPSMHEHEQMDRSMHSKTPTMRGYANGGMVYAADGEFIDNMEPLREPTAADRGEAPAAPAKFGDAFKAARASGAKEFEWQGKKYTTQMKGETSTKAPSTESSDGPTTTRMDDGSKIQKFDDGSQLATGTDGKVSATKATEDAKPAAPARSYKMQGRAYKTEDAGEKKKFSRFSTGGKYVPSTGVVVKKD